MSPGQCPRRFDAARTEPLTPTEVVHEQEPDQRRCRTGGQAAAVFGSVSCGQTAGVHTSEQGGQRAAIVKRVFDDVLNQGRYELFAGSYDTAFVKHVNGRTFNLQEEIEQAKGTRAMANDLNMTVDHLMEEGDFVAVRYTARGSNSGVYGGVAGTKFVLSGATFYRFSGSKIVEEWTFYDELELRRQFGIPPSGK